MKKRSETQFKPIELNPGDSLCLYEGEHLLLEDKITKDMTVTRAVTFDIEKSDGLGGIGIGGAFLEAEGEV